MPSDDVARDRRASLLAARDGLLRELAAIATTAAESARSRCPYRDRQDRCTFGGGCRNQRRDGEPALRCSGGPLDPRPAGKARVAPGSPGRVAGASRAGTVAAVTVQP